MSVLYRDHSINEKYVTSAAALYVHKNQSRRNSDNYPVGGVEHALDEPINKALENRGQANDK
jgi:hypothetical protein